MNASNVSTKLAVGTLSSKTWNRELKQFKNLLYENDEVTLTSTKIFMILMSLVETKSHAIH